MVPSSPCEHSPVASKVRLVLSFPVISSLSFFLQHQDPVPLFKQLLRQSPGGAGCICFAEGWDGLHWPDSLL